jgi:hypothetical protein
LRRRLRILNARADEVAEKWMRTSQTALQLGMELHGKEPRMVFEFDNLHQIAFRLHAADT